ncbi:MAG: hypothetical protein ACERKV_03640 [Clostridiaceae bacterium]
MCGEYFIKEVQIPIKTQEDIIINLTIRVDNKNNYLRLINNSDDQLVIRLNIGGYYMDASYIAATRLNTPIVISSIGSINNKTITVILNQPFTGNEKFEIFESEFPLIEIPILVTEDSVAPADNKKVIVADDRFETDKEYILYITKDTDVISSTFKVEEPLLKPINAEVQAVGNRILNILFETPIDHLDYIDSDERLLNFYMLYYNLDTNNATNSDNDWLGLIEANLDPPTGGKVRGITVRKSLDYKSLEIQLDFRGFPIGTSGLIIDYSKDQNPGNNHFYLHDFSDDEVIVASMRKEFDVVSDSVTAKVDTVVDIDRNHLIVKFDKPVIKKIDEMQVMSINGVLATVTEVIRVGNEFKELEFVLRDPVPLESIDVTVGRITDANGYLTKETLVPNVPVYSVPAEIQDVDQYNQSQSQISVTFTKDMQNDGGIGGVLNPNYHSITKAGLPVVNPIDLISYSNKMAIITFHEDLVEGSYELSASEIKDTTGLDMKPGSHPFNIINTSIPDIESVTYRTLDTGNIPYKTMVVAKFNQFMSYTGDHSIENIENYLINNNPLDDNSTSLIMKDSKWVRLTLQAGNSVNLPLGDGSHTDYTKINVGYPKVKDIRYVQSAVGNIYPICDLRDIVGPIEELDISSYAASVVSSEVLEYVYGGDNEFYIVDSADFTVERSTDSGVTYNTIQPSSFVKVNDKTLRFIFPMGTFDSSNTDIRITTKATGIQSTDIYGLPITAAKSSAIPASNEIRATLQAVSLITDDATQAILRMKFNKDIGNLSIADFACYLETEFNILGITDAEIPEIPVSHPDVIELTVSLPRQLLLEEKLYIKLGCDPSQINTEDTNGNKIDPFAPIEVSRFTANSIVWKAPSVTGVTNIANNIMELNLKVPIELANPGSPIEATKIGFTPNGDASKVTMIITGQESFGTVEFTGTGLEPASPILINTEEVAVEVLDDGKKIRLTFDSAETATLVLANVTKVEYIPFILGNETILDKDGTIFAYADYKPNCSISNV